RGQIVLLDFGLAKGSVGQLTAVTTSASIFGYTPNYAPLEQVQGKGTDSRSDIYALGATLYHLVTNVKPPDALSRASAVVNGLEDPLLPANEVCPAVGPALSNVLGKAMSQKRDDRFATASDMGHALGGGDYTASGEATLVNPGAAAFAASPTVTSEKATRLVGDQTRRTTSPSLPSEAQTLVAGEATSVRTVTTGPGAVAPTGRTNLKPFVAAAVLLIVAAGGVAGFYAYRRQRAQPTTTQPTETQTQSQPAQPSTNSGAQTNESKDVTGDTAKTSQTKTDKSKPETPRTETQRSTQTPPQDPFKNFPPPEVFDPAHQADPNRGRDRNPQTGQPPFDPTRPPPEDRRGFHPPLRMPEVRPLPNGGRIIKQPDGSMIMISPDGKTTTIPARPDRRNPRQKGNTNGNDNQGRP
ncbi:MAG TPA: hypothetical protein VHP99_10640, partial [Pyrinomonadaceae bacterium]|nr:hypothetical protein [Pyrinomonadaceae bacterium]